MHIIVYPNGMVIFSLLRTPVSENVSIEIENKPITSVPSSPATKSLLKKPKSDSRISDEHLLQYLNSHDSTIQSQVCYSCFMAYNLLFGSNST